MYAAVVDVTSFQGSGYNLGVHPNQPLVTFLTFGTYSARDGKKSRLRLQIYWYTPISLKMYIKCIFIVTLALTGDCYRGAHANASYKT